MGACSFLAHRHRRGELYREQAEQGPAAGLHSATKAVVIGLKGDGGWARGRLPGRSWWGRTPCPRIRTLIRVVPDPSPPSLPFLNSTIAIILGIALLFGGGELFVAGSVALSLLLGIPQIVIGLTVVSMGTSAPELFVSLLSTIQGNLGVAGADNLAVSNIVGSNIFNGVVVLAPALLVFLAWQVLAWREQRRIT